MARTKGNPILPGGVERYGRAVQFKRTLKYKRKKVQTKPTVAKAPTTKTVKVGGDKNGSTRTIPLKKANRFVVAGDVNRPRKARKTQKPTKVRASITPGTILILLSGPYRGSRVVCLKALESGLILVSGPFSVNGVPLRRVDQAYVIATSQKIDMSGVSISDDLNDDFFSKSKAAAKPADFTDDAEKATKFVSDARKKAQKEVDAQLLKAISGIEHMKHYLKAKFALSKGQFPHSMKF
jgi:large subunit ribosomal protein L6e